MHSFCFKMLINYISGSHACGLLQVLWLVPFSVTVLDDVDGEADVVGHHGEEGLQAGLLSGCSVQTSLGTQDTQYFCDLSIFITYVCII